jgi:hypothetical protein
LYPLEGVVMMLLGDVCMLSEVFFVEYFLSLLIGSFVFSISRFNPSNEKVVKYTIGVLGYQTIDFWNWAPT